MSGIFDQIFRYRQSEHSTPRENYFTETFVEVLERYEPLRIAFVALLLDRDNVERENIETVHMETQKSFKILGNTRIPDIWVQARDGAGKRHILIIENKIDSDVIRQQLFDYADILERERGAKSRTLVCITKNSVEPDFLEAIRQDTLNRENVDFQPRKWFEVYRKLDQEHQPSDECVGDMGNELLRLMEDWNMNGTLSAAHLRAAVTCIGDGVGRRLRAILDDAWYESGIHDYLADQWAHNQWSYRYDRARFKSPPINGYQVRLQYGFRYDRRDEYWDVDRLELPSPVVTVYPEPNVQRDLELPQRPENWETGPVEGWSKLGLWTRQPIPGNMPRLGEPLDEYYKNFFLVAFGELMNALEGDG